MLNANGALDLAAVSGHERAMTVAARPEPEPEPRPAGAPEADPGAHDDADGWALLDGLRRKLDDQVSQTRRTQLQVSQLAESIGALVEVQRRRTRGLNLNSFVAYLVFTTLCASGAYLLYRSRAADLVDGRDKAASERDAAVRRADEATTRAVARDAADAKVLELYSLLEAGKRTEAAKRLGELDGAPIPKPERELLVARVKQAGTIAVDAAMKTASAAFKAQKFSEVIAPLEQALTIEPTGPRAAEMHYMIGVARSRVNELPAAITQLDAAIAAEVAEDDARFQLASVLDRAGQWGKARGEYDKFATAHPQHPFALFAMRRSATLVHLPPIAPPQPIAARPAAAGTAAAAKPAAAAASASGTAPASASGTAPASASGTAPASASGTAPASASGTAAAAGTAPAPAANPESPSQ